MISYLFRSYDDFLSRCELVGQAIEPYPFCSTSSQTYSFFSKCQGAVLTTQFSRIDQWLRETSLFKEAWFKVVSSSENWWWSFEVCSITTSSFGLFLRNEGKRLSIPNVFLFMVLGQLVAISVSQNLFFLALSLRPLIDGSLEQLASLKCESEDLLLFDEEGIEEDVINDIGSSRSTSLPNHGVDRSENSSNVRSSSLRASKEMPPPRYPSNTSIGNTSIRKTSTTSKGITRNTEVKTVTQHMILQLEGRFSRACIWFFVLFGTLTNDYLPKSNSFLPTALIHLSSLLIFIPTSTLENFKDQVIKLWNDDRIISQVVREWVFRNVFSFIPPNLDLQFSTLNLLVALINFGYKLKYTLTLAFEFSQSSSSSGLENFLSTFTNAFFSHPAQTSISYDNLFITITTVLFILIDSKQRSKVGLLKTSELNSFRLLAFTTLLLFIPSVTLSVYLAQREKVFEENLEKNEKVLIGSLLGSNFEKDRKRGLELQKQLEEKKSRKWVVTVVKEVKKEEIHDGNVLKKRE